MRAFVVEYIANNGNGAAAARAAGYSPNNAKDGAKAVLRNPWIKAELAKRRSAVARRANITLDEVVDTAREVRDRCMQAVAAMDDNGNPTGEYRFDANNALMANHQLARLTGLYAPEKQEVKGVIVNVMVRGA